MSNFIISIEGNIGSGKSTFINILKEYFKGNDNIIFVDEPVDMWNTIQDKEGNTILKKFYEDSQKYAFSFQMMAYISRLSMIRECYKKNVNKIIITERNLYTDKNVFAKMLYDDGKIEEIDYQIYTKWFNEFVDDIPINGIIYVRCDHEKSYERVLKRNRIGENIPLSYLENCNKYHENWLINEMSNIDNLLIFDANIDKTKNFESYKEWINHTISFIYKLSDINIIHNNNFKYDNKLNYIV